MTQPSPHAVVPSHALPKVPRPSSMPPPRMAAPTPRPAATASAESQAVRVVPRSTPPLARPATMPPPPMHPNAALSACNSCAAACELASARLESLASCLALQRDCADACALLARWIARESAQSAALCRTCVEVCEACAGECERFPEDEHARRCAIECRRCANECRLVMARANQRERH